MSSSSFETPHHLVGKITLPIPASLFQVGQQVRILRRHHTLSLYLIQALEPQNSGLTQWVDSQAITLSPESAPLTLDTHLASLYRDHGAAPILQALVRAILHQFPSSTTGSFEQAQLLADTQACLATACAHLSAPPVRLDPAALDYARREAADVFFAHDDLLGFQVKDANGWTHSTGQPEWTRTVFVEFEEQPDMSSIAMKLVVRFAPESDTIVSASIGDFPIPLRLEPTR